MYSLCRLRPAGPDRSPFVIDFNVHICTGQTDRRTGMAGRLERETDRRIRALPSSRKARDAFLRVLRVAAAGRPDVESRHGHRGRVSQTWLQLIKLHQSKIEKND